MKKLHLKYYPEVFLVNSPILFKKLYTTQKLYMKQLRESLIFLLLTGKLKEDIKLQPSTGGTRLDHVLFEKPRSSRKVGKRSGGCYEVINQNEGRANSSGRNTSRENCM